MIHESPENLRLQEPSALNIMSRINAALDIIDLGLSRANRPIITTKFGPQSSVLLHLVTKVMPNIPVVWADTGFNTPATREFANNLARDLNLNLHHYVPLNPWRDVIPAEHDPQRDEFVEQVKLEPFRRALSEQDPDIWITGLRREQTEFRDGLSPFQHVQDGIVKVCPLIDWREADMTAYAALNQLPGETDYFDPTKAAPHLECGIHNRL